MEAFDFPAIIKNDFIDVSQLSPRQKIELLEYGLLDPEVNVVDELPLHHFVCNGVYYRELTIPSGVVLTGKIHKTEHVSICIQGDISVMTDEGMKRITAPFTLTSQPGMKRAGYAHTETIWATIHKTDKTDLTEIENDLFEDSDLSWITNLLSGDTTLCQQQLPQALSAREPGF